MRGSGVRSLFCRVPRRLPIAAGTITRFSRDARAVEKHPGGRWTHVQRPLCSYRPRARTPDRHSGDAGANASRGSAFNNVAERILHAAGAAIRLTAPFFVT